MVDKQEMRHASMQQGRDATVIASLVKPYLDERLSRLIAKLASLYRSGQTDFPALLGTTAQITFCLDMMSDLEGRVRKGSLAAQQEFGQARSEDAPRPS